MTLACISQRPRKALRSACSLDGHIAHGEVVFEAGKWYKG